MSTSFFDLAIAGGNTTAYTLAHLAAGAGLSVLLLDLPAPGPQVEVIWTVKQAPAQLEASLNARAFFLDLFDSLDLPFLCKGALLLAFQEEEMTVLEEFAAKGSLLGYTLQMLTPEETLTAQPVVSPVGLEGALLSPMEVSYFTPLLLERWRGQLKERGVCFRHWKMPVSHRPLADRLRDLMPARRRLICAPRLGQQLLGNALLLEEGLQWAEGRTGPAAASAYLADTGWVEMAIPAFDLCESLPLLRPDLRKGCGCEMMLLPAPGAGYYWQMSTRQHRNMDIFGASCTQKARKRLGLDIHEPKESARAGLRPGFFHIRTPEGLEVCLAEGDIYKTWLPERAKEVLFGAAMT